MSRSHSTATRTAATPNRSALSLTPNRALQPLYVQREATASGARAEAAQAIRLVVESPGRPLDSATRAEMEPKFGYDLSSVRLHTDEPAAASARAVAANAYTAGSHIAFDSGRYSPGSASGQRLMTHELAHVVQQTQGPVAGTAIGEGVQVSHPSDRFEQQARETAGARGGEPAAPAIATPDAERAGPLRRLSARTEKLSIQRSDEDTSAAGSLLGGLGGVGSFLTSIAAVVVAARAADAAERQTAAAEDPPQGTPTLGGLTSTHVDIPETKKLKTAAENDKTGLQEDADTTETTTTTEPEKKSKSGAKTTRKTERVRKDADKPTVEETFDLVRIRQTSGKEVTDYATFGVRIDHNGEDIKGGGTEDREREGYLGGTHNANASITFKSRTAPQDADSSAGVYVSFTGLTAPARVMIPQSSIFKQTKPSPNSNYQIQSFSGGVTFRTIPPDPKSKNPSKPNAGRNAGPSAHRSAG